MLELLTRVTEIRGVLEAAGGSWEEMGGCQQGRFTCLRLAFLISSNEFVNEQLMPSRARRGRGRG